MVPYPSIRADESSGPCKQACVLQEEAINTVSFVSVFKDLTETPGCRLEVTWFYLRKKESGVGVRVGAGSTQVELTLKQCYNARETTELNTVVQFSAWCTSPRHFLFF